MTPDPLTPVRALVGQLDELPTMKIIVGNADDPEQECGVTHYVRRDDVRALLTAALQQIERAQGYRCGYCGGEPEKGGPIIHYPGCDAPRAEVPDAG